MPPQAHGQTPEKTQARVAASWVCEAVAPTALCKAFTRGASRAARRPASRRRRRRSTREADAGNLREAREHPFADCEGRPKLNVAERATVLVAKDRAQLVTPG